MKRSLQFKMNTEEGKWKLLDKLYLKIELGKRRKNKNYLIPILTLELIEWAGVKTGLSRPGPGFQVYLTTFQGCYASRAWHIQGLIMKILIQQHIQGLIMKLLIQQHYHILCQSTHLRCRAKQTKMTKIIWDMMENLDMHLLLLTFLRTYASISMGFLYHWN